MQQVLAGRYRLERQLGKGGMGSVWLAEHLALRSWVAVKLMDPAIAATPEGAERFRREAQAAASLRSAHVVQVLDYGLHEATPFLVMELLQGESLAACLERERRLAPDRTLAIVTQVARALGRAHAAGIVHRDLKPDNVFLVREDDQELVKILDFGIAKTPAAKFGGLETRTGVTMGTPYYMSPEQVEGKKAVDHRTDLWAMAVITSECLTGTRPFDGSTYGELLLNICARPIPVPSSIGPVPPAFDAWFARATNRDPEQRFATAQELAAALRDVVIGAQAAPAPGAGRIGTGTEHMAHPPADALATAPPAAATPPRVAPAAQAGLAAASPAGLAAAPSTHTSQPLEVTKNMPARSSLPWLLVAGAALLGAGIGALLLLRGKPEEPAAVAASAEPASAEPNSAEPAPASPPARELVPETAPAPPPAPAATSASPEPPAVAPAPTPAAVTLDVPKLTSPGTQKTAAPAPPAPAPSPGSAKTARCFSDPFSGQIRLAGSGRGSEGPTFPCKQDPFTGKYKRL